ncbi:MAG: matrixin family metalloprotease [Cyanobacteria bacterium SZAS-4]|nr:matrixin family metalloprotease [Cyanobacteria bacterium SZAS-4]
MSKSSLLKGIFSRLSMRSARIWSATSVKMEGAIAPLMLALLVSSEISALLPNPASAYRAQGRTAARGGGGGGAVYPEFRSNYGTIRWISDQMPIKVYIAPGLTLDSIIDPSLGAPFTNVDGRDRWPDLVADVISNPQTFQSLQVAQGYVPEHFQAAVQGINSWKAFERDGIRFQIVEDPGDADIHVFWTNHFVNKLGLGLFQNDIRGYTAKRSFPYKAIMSGKQAQFKPVVTLLRTTESNGVTMPFMKMKASAAHEFGHALGIEGHSPYPSDLMSVYYGRGAISTNDAATIRYLYRMTPDLIP